MEGTKKTDLGTQSCVATPPGFGAKQARLIQCEKARGRRNRSVYDVAIDYKKLLGATTPTRSTEKGTSRRTRKQQLAYTSKSTHHVLEKVASTVADRGGLWPLRLGYRPLLVPSLAFRRQPGSDSLPYQHGRGRGKVSAQNAHSSNDQIGGFLYAYSRQEPHMMRRRWHACIPVSRLHYTWIFFSEAPCHALSHWRVVPLIQKTSSRRDTRFCASLSGSVVGRAHTHQGSFCTWRRSIVW